MQCPRWLLKCTPLRKLRAFLEWCRASVPVSKLPDGNISSLVQPLGINLATGLASTRSWRQRLEPSIAPPPPASRQAAFWKNLIHVRTFALAEKVGHASGLRRDLWSASCYANHRLAIWQSLHPCNCDDLKTLLGQFPASPFANRHVTETPVWTPVTHQLVLHQSQSDDAGQSRRPHPCRTKRLQPV